MCLASNEQISEHHRSEFPTDIATIVRGKLHPREWTGDDAKNTGGGAIEKPDAGCIIEELAGNRKWCG